MRGKNQGFTLIETLVAITLLAMIIIGLYGALNLGIRLAQDSQARVGATSLVGQRMEMVRNLSYDDIGTRGGYPSGTLLQEEEIILNNITYTLKASIRYIDDPTDGEGPLDENGVITDYKQVRVEASWSTREGQTKSVLALSNFAPKGIETSVGGGALVINVFNASGQAVSQAEVYIENSASDPVISIGERTNDQGKLTFIGPASVASYEIRVTKAGYSTTKTYKANESNPNPEPPHQTIYQGESTVANFQIDLLSTLSLDTLEPSGLVIPNVPLTIRSSKTIGTDLAGEPIYKYQEVLTTDSNGHLDLPELEWDIYDVSLVVDSQIPDYDLASSLPPEPINIAPATNNTLELTLADHVPHTLLVTLWDAEGNYLPSALANLSNTEITPSYDETIETGSSGQSFFSPLAQDNNYSLRVTLAGYETYELGSISISGQTEIGVVLTSFTTYAVGTIQNPMLFLFNIGF